MTRRFSLTYFRSVAIAAALFWIAGCGKQADAPTTEAAPRTPVNVILLISDGGGYNSFAAASYYAHGQLGQMEYDSWPVQLACTTYAINEDGELMGYDPAVAYDMSAPYVPATDSAAAATAIYTGVKTTGGRISMNADGEPLTTLGQIAHQQGWRVGVVTTVPISHATPGALAAHNADRGNYAEIAAEMLTGDVLDVVMGCGHPEFDQAGQPVIEPIEEDYVYVGGSAMWADLAAGETDWTLVTTREQVDALAIGQVAPPERLLGVACVRQTLQQQRPGEGMGDRNEAMPDLPSMVLAALNTLSAEGEPFLLVVEAGAVDWANHNGQGGRMIEEQLEFCATIEAVMAWLADRGLEESTLVIITADHETGDLRGPIDEATGLPTPDLVSQGAGEKPNGLYVTGGHTNHLVPLFATGPGAEAFSELIDGTDPIRGQYVDNTDIIEVIRRALVRQPVEACCGIAQ
jgi:alkaline phosphatase